MEMGKALQIIEDVRGTQLCPECVALFFTWIAQGNKHQELSDAGVFSGQLMFKGY